MRWGCRTIATLFVNLNMSFIKAAFTKEKGFSLSVPCRSVEKSRDEFSDSCLMGLVPLPAGSPLKSKVVLRDARYVRVGGVFEGGNGDSFAFDRLSPLWYRIFLEVAVNKVHVIKQRIII